MGPLPEGHRSKGTIKGGGWENEDKKDDIYECLREAETDDVNAILKELGEDEYSEEEVRLMRIKFISEFGN